MSSTSGHQVEDTDLVRRRVSRFGRNLTVAVLVVVAARVLVIKLMAAPDSLIAPWLLSAGAVYAALWLALRDERGWSLSTIRFCESAAFVLSAVAFAMMALSLPAESVPALVLLLTLSFGLILRAVLVPSSMEHTVALAVVLAVPLGVVIYLLDSPPLLPQFIFIGIWWIAGAAVAAIASRVVYGLRREVRRATRLGQYSIERQLGKGGMGVVYRARHGMLKRPTAVKVLRPDHTSEIDIARFEREVQLTSQLSHPNTVKIYDYGRTHDGLFFYAMELLEGASLAEVVVVDGPQSPGRVASVLEQVAGALAEAHGIGLIHRDIKPSNILLVAQGGCLDFAKVVDFGLVKELDAPGSLTGENALLGTPLYLAPEAIRAPSEIDARVDIYALGAVGYYLLTASEVFDSGNIVEVCTAHMYAEPEPPSRRLGKPLPPDLEELVLDCLAKDPAARPQSADELIERLEPIVAREAWSRADAAAWWEDFGPKIDQHRVEVGDKAEAAGDLAPAYLAAASRIRDALWQPSAGGRSRIGDHSKW